jgi:hypothetical protein
LRLLRFHALPVSGEAGRRCQVSNNAANQP